MILSSGLQEQALQRGNRAEFFVCEQGIDDEQMVSVRTMNGRIDFLNQKHPCAVDMLFCFLHQIPNRQQTPCQLKKEPVHGFVVHALETKRSSKLQCSNTSCC